MRKVFLFLMVLNFSCYEDMDEVKSSADFETKTSKLQKEEIELITQPIWEAEGLPAPSTVDPEELRRMESLKVPFLNIKDISKAIKGEMIKKNITENSDEYTTMKEKLYEQ